MIISKITENNWLPEELFFAGINILPTFASQSRKSRLPCKLSGAPY